MDSAMEVNHEESYETPKQNTELQIKNYVIEIQCRYLPFLSKSHKCYRHEVTDTGHLVLYRVDKTQIAIPVAKRSWIVYANYWDFMNQFKK